MSKTILITIFLVSILIVFIQAQTNAKTTILIDDFSTATGEVTSFTSSSGDLNCFYYECVFDLTNCKTQKSSSILGGKRIAFTEVSVAAGTQSEPVSAEDFGVSLQGDINVSNQTWNSHLDITNTGSSSWFVVNFMTEIEYISGKFCEESNTKPTPIDLTVGGGKYIAFTVHTDSSSFTPGVQLSVEDVNANLGYAIGSDNYYYNSDLGQYVVEMNLQEDDVDVDFTQVTYISIQVVVSISYPITIDPTDAYSLNVAVSDVRVISFEEDNNNGGSSSNSLSSSSKSSKSSSSNSSRSSGDHSSNGFLLQPFSSLLLCIFVIILIFA